MERIIKPRVFLSHSKMDISFIDRVYNDLNKCQIDPWRDDMDIRHGQPWLDAIFEFGIPTCDSILVYITENSINSSMVKKEIDASVIQKLKDNNVALLPYVTSKDLRAKLRSDIQSLQVPEWNNSNYLELLPIVVAEIWRSYLERTIQNAINNEKVRRLQAESELQKLQSDENISIFSVSETKDFEYIYNSLNRNERIEINEEIKKEDNTEKSHIVSTKYYNVNLISLVSLLIKAENHRYYRSQIHDIILDTLYPNRERITNEGKIFHVMNQNYTNELLMYGFISRVHLPPKEKDGVFGRITSRSSYIFLYDNKIDRFKYWMVVNSKLPDKVLIEPTK